MLEALDRYKYGLLTVLAVFLILFIWTQMDKIRFEFEIVPFTKTGRIETKEEIKLTPDNIHLSDKYAQDVLNMADNVSDGRKTSTDDYYENQTPEQAAKSIADLENEMKRDAGGAKERARLEGLIADRKAHQQALLDKIKNNPKLVPNKGGAKKYAGQTMVSFDLGGRDAYQNNKWFVRNPGYKCDNSSRVTVIVDIIVGNDGYVTSAVYNSAKSSGASSCEINSALTYAKKSRFMYKASGGNQSGWISYIFMPK
ncbi:MAG: hypothetical protein HRT57_16860 [Crocinitomicaceae bacterium]|nr:hypothetical protein [Crocinitomicaceae bacterium]